MVVDDRSSLHGGHYRNGRAHRECITDNTTTEDATVGRGLLKLEQICSLGNENGQTEQEIKRQAYTMEKLIRTTGTPRQCFNGTHVPDAAISDPLPSHLEI